MRIQVDVTGLDSLLDDPSVLRRCEEIAELGASHARDAVPVDTKALHDSITVEPIPGGFCFGSDLDYAAPVEFGYTHHISGQFIPAQPYLRPALDSVT